MKTQPPVYFLTPYDIQQILHCLPDGGSTRLSLNLGITTSEVQVTSEHIRVGEHWMPLPASKLLEQGDERTILIYRHSSWEKWQYFNENTNRLYKPIFIKPGAPPTIEISGIKMHVTENGDPAVDTRRKLRFLKGSKGIVWDTCCGMGYSAQWFARLPDVQLVLTTEVDETMLTLCRENPWAQELFESPSIQVIRANAASFVSMLGDHTLAAILHDPPRFNLAPELYEIAFYRELWRVLRTGGKVYHYTGNPRKHQSKGLPIRTAERMTKAGFTRVKLCYQGVCAQKL